METGRYGHMANKCPNDKILYKVELLYFIAVSQL